MRGIDHCYQDCIYLVDMAWYWKDLADREQRRQVHKPRNESIILTSSEKEKQKL